MSAPSPEAPARPPTRPAAAGGIYVHFAYCTHRCVYCDFALATPRTIPAARYTDALVAELASKAETLGGPARTLYIGGGTPSLWPTAELGRFLRAVRAAPGIAEGAEITIEANPEEVTDAWLEEVLALGVNRISLGVQSFDAAALAALSRTHGVAAAEAALARLQAAHRRGALASFSLDLMYGLGGQTLARWLGQLEAVVDRFDPPHLSLYALTVEAPTVLGLRVRRGQAAAPDDALQAEMLFGARDFLASRGYSHYEVSSWARAGHRSLHNSAYWELRPWLGLGAGATEHIAGQRTRNEPRPSRYLSRILAGSSAEVERELPDARTLAFERILTGLRRLDTGVSLPDARFDPIVRAEVEAGRLTRLGMQIRLTDLGLRYMDDVLLAFVPDVARQGPKTDRPPE
jgi:oxygen-independent coproporphyrinogen-3 oxidase